MPALFPRPRLPVEVLTQIFLFYVADNANTPLILTQVSSSWRRIALRLPTLWTHLNLTRTIHPTLPHASPFAPRGTKPPLALGLGNIASLWFKRARKQLLTVSISLTASSVTVAHDVSSSITEPILSNAHSIQHLSIHVTSKSQLDRFFTTHPANFCNLKTLSLSIDRSEESNTPITVFRNAPLLTKVSFDLNGSPPSTSFIHIPWNQLQQLDMTGASILPADKFHTLLGSCTNLRTAMLWVEDATDPDTYVANNNPTITLPNLTQLTISFYGRRQKTASSLLTPFDLPHLRYFQFFSGFITLPFIPTIPSGSLQDLVLSGISVSATRFLSFTANNTSLSSLTLDLRYFNEDISALLRVLGTASPRILPNLSNLSLWTTDIFPHSAAYSYLIRTRAHWLLSSSEKQHSPNNSLRLELFLARQQHGACCRCSTCDYNMENGSTPLDDIFSVVDVCEKTRGVELYISNVRPDQGITW